MKLRRSGNTLSTVEGKDNIVALLSLVTKNLVYCRSIALRLFKGMCFCSLCISCLSRLHPLLEDDLDMIYFRISIE